jgi:sensor histidine kinase YesM
MKTNLVKQFFIIAFFLSLAIAVTIHFPMIINYIFGDEGSGGRHRGYNPDLAHLMGDIILTFVIALVMFTLNFFILNPAGKHGKMNIYRIVFAVFLTIVSVYLLNSLLHPLFHEVRGSRPRGRRDEFDYINFFVSGLVIASTLVIRLVFQKQNVMLENEKLRREALQSQYESLKNQISPHFLFNSLTALNVLVKEDADQAQNYISSLSKALRYTLKSNEKKLVSLSEEMEFMKSYLFLIRMRYGENLEIKTLIDEEMLSYLLPPLTIQTLVENAIKHNEISKRKPLTIDISTTSEGKLVIVNDIQQKITGEEGTGIGLTNLSKQFMLLIGKDIIIRRSNGQFSVEVPLIKEDL